MRFRTIWSLRGSPLKERLLRTLDWAAMKVAANLPVRVRFWTTILEVGHATAKSPEVPATDLTYILNHLRTPKHMS
jgi:hypothetical protein